ncbi:DUF4190 domain-containing protein [Nocardioidaceae bacterium]|nr:DUF4190 domain-containing protein [Nocardioidaceae bacterium]
MSDQQTPPGGYQGGSQNPYGPPGDGQQGPPAQYGGHDGGYQTSGSSGGSGMAITALILGIISIIGGFFLIGGYLFGIPAIIVGAIASSKAKKGRAQGRGLAIGGSVTGVIGLLISIAFTVVTVFLFQAADFGSLTECLQQAGNDQDAVAQCEQEFTDNLENRLGS